MPVPETAVVGAIVVSVGLTSGDRLEACCALGALATPVKLPRSDASDQRTACGAFRPGRRLPGRDEGRGRSWHEHCRRIDLRNRGFGASALVRNGCRSWYGAAPVRRGRGEASGAGIGILGAARGGAGAGEASAARVLASKRIRDAGVTSEKYGPGLGLTP